MRGVLSFRGKQANSVPFLLSTYGSRASKSDTLDSPSAVIFIIAAVVGCAVRGGSNGVGDGVAG